MQTCYNLAYSCIISDISISQIKTDHEYVNDGYIIINKYLYIILLFCCIKI